MRAGSWRRNRRSLDTSCPLSTSAVAQTIWSAGSPGKGGRRVPATSAISGVTGIGETPARPSARRTQVRSSGSSRIRPRRSSVATSQTLIVETPTAALSSMAVRAAGDSLGSSAIHHSQDVRVQDRHLALDVPGFPGRVEELLVVDEEHDAVGERRRLLDRSSFATGLPRFVTTIVSPVSATSFEEPKTLGLEAPGRDRAHRLRPTTMVI
jgi:hypothetical protein